MPLVRVFPHFSSVNYCAHFLFISVDACLKMRQPDSVLSYPCANPAEQGFDLTQ